MHGTAHVRPLLDVMDATDYDDILVAGSEPPLGQPNKEYNAQIDPIAVRKLLTDCTFPLWQVPRNTYRQCLVSTTELAAYVRPFGELGAYCLGDSPLVSLTALLTPWDTALASSQ